MLADDDIGYWGSGQSLSGGGHGTCSGLTRIQLQYVDEAGTITVQRGNETIVLEAYEAWLSDEETEIWDWMGEDCVVTSTHRMTNYAFQDRDKIIHAPW